MKNHLYYLMLCLLFLSAISTALGTTYSIMPDTSDGYLLTTDDDPLFGQEWNEAHDATDADTVYKTQTVAYAGSQASQKFFPNTASINRASFDFNITALEIQINDSEMMCGNPYVALRGVNPIADTCSNDEYSYFALVNNTKASDNDLVVGDYDQIGDAIDNPTMISDTMHIDDWKINQYNKFYLTDDAIAWYYNMLDDERIMQIGFREGHDIEDVKPTGSTTLDNSVVRFTTVNFLLPTGRPYMGVDCFDNHQLVEINYE